MELLYWIFHKNRLYICCCSDNSEMSIIKVYANWRVIVSVKARNPAKKRKGEECGRSHMLVNCMYPLVTVYMPNSWLNGACAML